MKILLFSNYFYPHVGGVEKHVLEVAKSLISKGNKVTILTRRFDKISKQHEVYDGITVIRFPFNKIKYIGLINIWVWLLQNRGLIRISDLVHCHDVFIWYLPFKLIYPDKKVVTTIHGLEWDKPLVKQSLFQKWLAIRHSSKVVGIGKFLEKYLNARFDLLSYGAISKISGKNTKESKTIVYVGRLEKNTGLLRFLKWINKNRFKKIDFCGDGPLRKECEKYGTVHGFCDPTPFYEKAEICVPGGYLAALEALSYDCKLKLFWNNKVKEDYWKMSPFYKLKGEELKKWARQQTWEKLANEYLDLYNSIK